MAEVNATSPQQNTRLSDSMTKANNQTFNFSLQDYLYSRKPDFWVYIFNLSDSSFDVFRPPLFANLRIPGLTSQGVKVETSPDGTRYVRAAQLPSPLLVPQGSVDSYEVSTGLIDTRRVVQDICNPDNLSLDQNAVISKPTNVGNDLSKKGVFWSTTEIPTQQEVTDAKRRMEAHYNKIIEKFRALEVANPKELQDLLGPEAHAACDYFGIETTWHAKRSQPMDCPNCGDRIRKGVAFHKTEEGTLCIIDWKRAVSSGVRTRAQAIEAGAPGFEQPASPSTPMINAQSKPVTKVDTE